MKKPKFAIIRYVKRVFKDSCKPPSVSEILKKVQKLYDERRNRENKSSSYLLSIIKPTPLSMA